MRNHRTIHPFQFQFNIQFKFTHILHYILTWMHDCRKITEPRNKNLLCDRTRDSEDIPKCEVRTRESQKVQFHKDVNTHRNHFIDKFAFTSNNVKRLPNRSSPQQRPTTFTVQFFSFTFVLIWRQIENAVKFNLMPASECCVWLRSRCAAVSLINYNYYH